MRTVEHQYKRDTVERTQLTGRRKRAALERTPLIQ